MSVFEKHTWILILISKYFHRLFSMFQRQKTAPSTTGGAVFPSVNEYFFYSILMLLIFNCYFFGGL
jgi:hypothetical protein